MTRGRLLFASVSILCVFAIASGTFARAVTREEANDDSLYKSLSIFSEVLNLIRRTYVDETSVDQLFSGALDGTTDALDSLATFVPSDNVETYRQALEIGDGHSGVSVVKDRGISYVLSVAPGSPGAEIELERGDALAQVEGRSTRNMPLWQLQTLLAGEPGTELALEVVRRGQSDDRTLTLRAFEPQPPGVERREELPVLQLARLEEETVGEVRALLEELAVAGDDRLVVDLRGVAGGSGEAAYRVADLFVRGDLGALKRRSETLETFAGDLPPVWEGRLVVLIDRATQGSGEILAAVLHQAADAEMVGERTFGHAGRQSTVTLSTGGQLFLTDAFYTGPDQEPLDSSLVPEVAVNEGNRSLSEAGVPLPELILRRGLELLQELEPELEQVA